MKLLASSVFRTFLGFGVFVAGLSAMFLLPARADWLLFGVMLLGAGIIDPAILAGFVKNLVALRGAGKPEDDA